MKRLPQAWGSSFGCFCSDFVRRCEHVFCAFMWNTFQGHPIGLDLGASWASCRHPPRKNGGVSVRVLILDVLREVQGL